jgi:hypothetical protein
MTASRWEADFSQAPAKERPLEVHIDDETPEPESPVEPVQWPAAQATPASRPAKDSPAKDTPAKDSLARDTKARVQRGGTPGLTAPGVAVIVLGASALGAVIDSIVRGDLGTVFAIMFVASSVYAATQVRRRDLLAAVIVPPLVFLTVLGVHELLSPTGKSRALIDLVGDLVSTLALNAPTLWIGTGAAAVIVLVRHRRR